MRKAEYVWSQEGPHSWRDKAGVRYGELGVFAVAENHEVATLGSQCDGVQSNKTHTRIATGHTKVRVGGVGGVVLLRG